MSAKLLPVPRARFDDANGDPLSGGFVYTYISGTSTPLASYVDQSGLTPNSNPIVLDSQGYADIWLGAGSYKVVLCDSNNVVQWTVENISAADDGTLTNPWVTHSLTDAQVATDLTSQTIDLAVYSSAVYDVEITRGTTVIANGTMAVQGLNGTGRILFGLTLSSESHGVTFSLTQVGTVVQLQAASSSGPGAGKIKLSRKLIAV